MHEFKLLVAPMVESPPSTPALGWVHAPSLENFIHKQMKTINFATLKQPMPGNFPSCWNFGTTCIGKRHNEASFGSAGSCCHRSIARECHIVIHTHLQEATRVILTMAFLIRREGVNVGEALSTVRRSRRMADPNPSFMAQLRKMKLGGK